MPLSEHLRALGHESLPARIRLGRKVFQLGATFKHSSISAVGLYRADDGGAVVLKCYRSAPFFGVRMGWAGRLMAGYEAAVLRRVRGVRGTPRLRGRWRRTGIVRDYVPGRPLTRHTPVGDDFFDDLFRLLAELHERGIAYVDLEKASNIILGDDGLPHLIDFQVAFCVPDRFLGQTCAIRWVRRVVQQADLYHARKHFRRLMGDRLSEDRIAQLRRRPWFVRVSNLVHAPFKKARRRILGKE